MDSIMQEDKCCYICGRRDHLQCHHVYMGVPGRKNSEAYGLKVWLCMDHHTGPNGVHHNIEYDRMLKKIGQREFEKKYSRRDFMNVFGKNYLGD